MEWGWGGGWGGGWIGIWIGRERGEGSEGGEGEGGPDVFCFWVGRGEGRILFLGGRRGGDDALDGRFALLLI